MSTSIALPDPEFIVRDPNQVLADMKSQWETLTGKTMYPGQVEFLLTNLMAYREILLRVGIQEAAKQNLVDFARYPMLDYLGANVGVIRLLPSSATTVLRFTIPTIRSETLLIPIGTKVANGNLVFATDVEAPIPVGSTQVSVTATAVDTGIASNNLPVNSITTILNLTDPNLTVTNLTTSAGGLEMESDDRLRDRIKLAPNQFASAGPKGAYEFYVKSVRQDIIDVGVYRPAPGKVRIYPLLASGIPDQALLTSVFKALSDEAIRPLTDELEVLSPTAEDYEVTMHILCYRGTDGSAIKTLVETALAAYAAKLSRYLGQDLVASQWNAVAQGVTGVYRAWSNVPEEGGYDAMGLWLHNTAITVIFEGYVGESTPPSS
jgi:phage-related baseplate assembly protein